MSAEEENKAAFRRVPEEVINGGNPDLADELFAPDYVNVCYWALACQVEGLRYRYLVSTGRAPKPGTEMMGVSSDLEVDLRSLAGLLDEAKT